MTQEAESIENGNISDLPIEEQIIIMSAINYGHLPMMEVLFEQFQSSIVNILNDYTSSKTEVHLKSFEYMSFSETLRAIPNPTLFGIIKADPWNSRLGIVAEPTLIFTVLQKMLGGKLSSMPSKERSFTSIERRIGSKLYDVILNGLALQISELTPVKLNIEALEDNIKELDIAPNNSACAKVTMYISLEGQGGSISFIIPYIAFESVRSTFTQPFSGGAIGEKDSWRDLINESLQNTDITLTAIMQEMTTPLHELLSWKRGDIIDIGIDTEHEVKVICSGNKMLNAATGAKKNGSVALKITEVLHEIKG